MRTLAKELLNVQVYLSILKSLFSKTNPKVDKKDQ